MVGLIRAIGKAIQAFGEALEERSESIPAHGPLGACSLCGIAHPLPYDKRRPTQ